MRKFSAIFVLLALMALAVVPSFAQDEAPTIVDIVVASASAEEAEFTVLLAAVQAADPAIAEALSDPEGSYTVFAPTDAAYVALLEALGMTAEEVLGNTDLLNEVLLYHVVPGLFSAENVVALDGALLGTVLPGAALAVSVTDDGAFVNDSTIINTDIEASNGIVHVIDAVLVPAAGDEEMMEEEMEEEMMDESVSIAETVIAAASADAPQFTVLLQAVVAAGLDGLLTDGGPFTVFAPTDEAFVAALEALGLTAEELLADTETLTAVLAYHVVPGTFYAEDVLAVADAMEGEFEIATALSGTTVTIRFEGENVFVNDATVVATDIEASNGIIHVIDSVILPPADEE